MSEPPDAGRPRSRRWFVVLTWVTLVLFGAFVAAITVCAARIPTFRKARYGGLERTEAPCAAARGEPEGRR